MRVVRTRNGARIERGDLILSEIRRDPGPTDGLFDVLAACIAALVPGHKVAVLGFAGGGIVAPLRAMGFGHPFVAVDLSLEFEPLFRELSEPWCGQVDVVQDEASAWLRKQRTRYDLILEDISADSPDGITKPPVSLDTLPELMASRVRKGGLVVTNVLPVPGMPFTRLLPQLAAPHQHAHVITLDAWENRVLICGPALGSARDTSAALRRCLRAIGSQEAYGLSVRALG